MFQFVAQIETFVRSGADVVDKAAAASDRWLFLAALALLLGTMGMVIKWLVDSLEKKAEIHAEERIEWKKERKAEQDDAKAERKCDQSAYLASLDSLKCEMKGMTDELHKNTEVLTRHDMDMRNAHAIETRTIVEAELNKLGIKTSKHGGG